MTTSLLNFAQTAAQILTRHDRAIINRIPEAILPEVSLLVRHLDSTVEWVWTSAVERSRALLRRASRRSCLHEDVPVQRDSLDAVRDPVPEKGARVRPVSGAVDVTVATERAPRHDPRPRVAAPGRRNEDGVSDGVDHEGNSGRRVRLTGLPPSSRP